MFYELKFLVDKFNGNDCKVRGFGCVYFIVVFNSFCCSVGIYGNILDFVFKVLWRGKLL